jgi:hypothetical protein
VECKLRSRTWLSGWRPLLLVGIFYLALSVLWTLPVWISSHRIIGVKGDPVQFVWYIAWVPFALLHRINPLYSQYMGAPRGIAAMWPLPPIVYNLLVAPLTELINPMVGYNAAMVLALVSTGVASFALFRRACNRLWLVLSTSAIFTFGPYMTSEVLAGHTYSTAVAGILILALLLHELFVVQGWPARRTGILIGLVLLVQMVTDEELLVTSLMVFIFGVLIALWVFNGANGRSAHYVATALRWAALALPLILTYFAYQWFGPGAIHGQNAPPIDYEAPLLTFIIPGAAQLLSAPPTSHFVQSLWADNSELSAYIGLPLIVFVFWFARHRLTRFTKWLLLMTLLIAVLMLGPAGMRGGITIPSPEAFLSYLPLVGDLLPIRLGIYLDLFLMLFLLVALDRLNWQSIQRIVVLGIIALTWLPLLPVSFKTVSTPSFFTNARLFAKTIPGSPTVLVLPYTINSSPDIAMLWQAESDFGFSMPEGYWLRLSVGEPGNRYGPAVNWFNLSLYDANLTGRTPIVTTARRESAGSYLRSHHVQYVVLGPAAHEGSLRHYMEDVLRSKPIAIGGVLVWKLLTS